MQTFAPTAAGTTEAQQDHFEDMKKKLDTFLSHHELGADECLLYNEKVQAALPLVCAWLGSRADVDSWESGQEFVKKRFEDMPGWSRDQRV